MQTGEAVIARKVAVLEVITREYCGGVGYHARVLIDEVEVTLRVRPEELDFFRTLLTKKGAVAQIAAACP